MAKGRFISACENFSGFRPVTPYQSLWGTGQYVCDTQKLLGRKDWWNAGPVPVYTP